MKKILLSAAAVALAATAVNAENPKLHEVYPPFEGEIPGELSPANFIGATATGLPEITVTPGMDWQIGAYTIRDTFLSGANKKDYGDGYITIAGPAINGGQDTAEDFQKGFNLADLGGTCGKVIVINGSGSGLAGELAKHGATTTLSELKQLNGMPVMFWIPNPSTMEPFATDDGTRKVRLSIEYNLYHPAATDAMQAWQNVYINDDENNVRADGNADAGVTGMAKNFWYSWADKSDENSDPADQTDTAKWYDIDNGEDETAAARWNPERWMVSQHDFDLVPDKKEGVWCYAPRVKWEFKPDFFNTGGAVLIRGIYFSEVKGDNLPKGKRTESWKWYTLGAGAGVENIATEAANAPAEYFNLQGIRVNNPENGVFICRQGNKVTKVAK